MLNQGKTVSFPSLVRARNGQAPAQIPDVFVFERHLRRSHSLQMVQVRNAASGGLDGDRTKIKTINSDGFLGWMMTKSELIDAVVAAGGYPRRQVEIAVNAVFDAMVDSLVDGGRIELRGFGNFTVREYKSYTGRNPKTGEQVTVPKKRMPFFKVGKELRDRLND